ncbi:MAG: TRAP transporter small permease subunit [Lachnospiraceae bacterium]|nr:TRAP transporter small permease subunit [Lachnospiraceae bacterium]
MKKRKADQFEEYAIAILFIAALVVVVFQSVIKYIMPDLALITADLSQYIFCYISFIGIGYGLKYGVDLTVDLFGGLVKGTAVGKVFSVVENILYPVVYAALLVGAVQTMISVSGQVGANIPIPLPAVYFSAVFGFALGLFRWVQKVFFHKNEKEEA